MILGLFLTSNTAFTKELLLECTGKYDGQNLTDYFSINTSQKTWGNTKANKSKHNKVYIDNERFLRLYDMKYDKAWKCDMMASGMCSVGYGEINRSTGEYTSAIFEMPRSVIFKEWYDWIRAFHLISVMAWMAGMLYLPRLYVYHADAEVGSELRWMF